MMRSHLGNGDDFGEIILDSQESITRKILEYLNNQEIYEILKITENPCTPLEIWEKSSYSKATIYRRISDLVELGLLSTVKREEDKLGKYGAWQYVNTFFVISTRYGKTAREEENSNPIFDPIVQMSPKREFYGLILKVIRDYQK